jgi:signal transduction histidine kinase
VVEALDEGMVEDRATATRYLASAHRHLHHLESMIDDLFELARLDAGILELRRAPVCLADLVAEAREGMQMQADERSIRLEVQIAPAIPPIALDRRRIGRVLLNLLGNALRHTPEGGTVTILAEQDGATTRVSVRNTGEGIAPEDLDRIFERFYRGEKSRSREQGGAGLGLAIAKGLVKAHGGRIWAESTLGRGATISFALPVPASGPHLPGS